MKKQKRVKKPEMIVPGFNQEFNTIETTQLREIGIQLPTIGIVLKSTFKGDNFSNMRKFALHLLSDVKRYND